MCHFFLFLKVLRLAPSAVSEPVSSTQLNFKRFSTTPYQSCSSKIQWGQLNPLAQPIIPMTSVLQALSSILATRPELELGRGGRPAQARELVSSGRARRRVESPWWFRPWLQDSGLSHSLSRVLRLVFGSCASIFLLYAKHLHLLPASMFHCQLACERLCNFT